MTITAVIPTYRRRDALLASLANHLALKSIDEVIVIDDGSDDGTARAVEELALPRVRVISHERNRGLPAARNTGARAANTDWIVYLEDDCGFPDDYAERLLETAREEGADIVGAPWLHVETNAAARTAKDRPVERVSLLSPPWVHPRAPLETPFLPALALVNRRVFDHVQYDETLDGNFYREETDFFISARRAGFKVVLTPTTSSWQAGRWDGGCKMSQQVRYDYFSTRNTFRLLRKHGRWLRAEGLLERPMGIVFAQFLGPIVYFHLKTPLRAARNLVRRRVKAT